MSRDMMSSIKCWKIISDEQEERNHPHWPLSSKPNRINNVWVVPLAQDPRLIIYTWSVWMSLTSSVHHFIQLILRVNCETIQTMDHISCDYVTLECTETLLSLYVRLCDFSQFSFDLLQQAIVRLESSIGVFHQWQYTVKELLVCKVSAQRDVFCQ